MIPLMFDILPKAYAQNMQPVLMLGSAKTRLGVRKLQGDVSEMIAREICWASRALVLHDVNCDINVNDTSVASQVANHLMHQTHHQPQKKS